MAGRGCRKKAKAGDGENISSLLEQETQAEFSPKRKRDIQKRISVVRRMEGFV